MNIDQLRDRFPNETECRRFFESIIWQKRRRCPHFGYDRSCKLQGTSSRSGLYECYHCKRRFTVTTKTPMHSTKLPLNGCRLCIIWSAQARVYPQSFWADG